MSIYFFETTPSELEYIRKQLPGEEIRAFDGPLTSASQVADIGADAEMVSVFVHSHIGPDVLEKLPNLRMIATRSTGYDHINLPAAESRGIPVVNVPTYGENTVAEHTFALILALSRNLHKASTRAAAGDFHTGGLQGFDLKGKTLGVIGTGHVGLHVVRIAKGFGMDVLAHDPVRNIDAAEVLGFTYTTLADLLSKSDIITLHAVLNDTTRHVIGEKSFPHIKRGAILINTARGELVDTCALLQALDDGVLAGAGLDVLEGEQIISEEKQLLRRSDASQETLKMALINRELLRRPDLVVTPHIAFDSREAVERILDTTIANIRAFRAGAVENEVHT